MRRIVGALLATLALAACQTPSPVYSPPPPPPPPPRVEVRPPPDLYSDQDFAWSAAVGDGRIIGALAYHDAAGRYTCKGEDVLLFPETPWSRQRTIALYLSDTAAALPISEVKARTRPEHAADYARYARRTPCLATNRFVFHGLPDGAWFMITVATPVAGGERVAVMRRVVTGGGDVTAVLH